MKIRKIECPKNKISIKCPYAMKPTRIVIHNTAGDAPAQNEISYMHSNNKETSFHFAVDDIEVVQGIDLNRNAWHAGDGRGNGNLEGIAIEICYSKSGGERWLKAVDNAAELTAQLLVQYGWDISKVTKHQDYSGKHCPHRILDEYGWDNFLSLVRSYLTDEPVQSTTSQVNVVPHIVYAAYTNKWLPDVADYNDVDGNGFAGIKGKAITGIRAKVNIGKILYRVHLVKGKEYLQWVVDHDPKQGGYAGIYGKNIDGIQMSLQDAPGYAIEYRVGILGGSYLPWVRDQSGNADGYAGIYGKKIDRIQMRIVKV